MVKHLSQYPDSRVPRLEPGETFDRDVPRASRGHRTTIVERLLLLSVVVILPLGPYVPTVAGASVVFLVFVALGGYILLWRPRMFLKTVLHPVFLAGYALVGIGVCVELAHGSIGHREIVRIALMIFGAILVATLSRDRGALRFGMYGYILAGVWLSVFYLNTSYADLNAIDTQDYTAASQLREAIYSHDALKQNENAVAFYMAQGALVALIFALTVNSLLARYIFLGLGLLCLVGAFLPMSRSGILIFVCASAVVAYSRGMMQPTVLITAVVLILGVVMFVPDSVFSRFNITADTTHGGKFKDSRVKVYKAAWDHLPQYYQIGVGMKRYIRGYGERIGLGDSGTHNCFFQITMYWGLAGLIALLVLMWQSYRCLPTRSGPDPLKLCVLGLAVAAMGLSMFIHNIYAKEFTLALGALVGGNLWIWPQRRDPPAPSASKVKAPIGPPRLKPLAPSLNPIQLSPRRNT